MIFYVGTAPKNWYLLPDGTNTMTADIAGFEEGESMYEIGPNKTDENGVYTGDAMELCKEIPDGSIDLIFTDPPYAKKYLYLYDWLFEEAPRLLKEDGFLLTFVGGYWKDRLMLSAREHMEYFWDFAIFHPGNNSIMWPRKVIARAKSILCYRKYGSKAMPRGNALGAYTNTQSDVDYSKQFHIWGQNESASRYYVDVFSYPGDLVLDPFVGGGTTPFVAGIVLDRQWLCFDIEEDNVTTTRSRLKELPGNTLALPK